MSQKTVTIPVELFFDLCAYHVLGSDAVRRDTDLQDRITAGLQAKMDAIHRRQLYTAYKAANTPQGATEALQAYTHACDRRQ